MYNVYLQWWWGSPTWHHPLHVCNPCPRKLRLLLEEPSREETRWIFSAGWCSCCSCCSCWCLGRTLWLSDAFLQSVATRETDTEHMISFYDYLPGYVWLIDTVWCLCNYYDTSRWVIDEWWVMMMMMSSSSVVRIVIGGVSSVNRIGEAPPTSR